MTPPARFITAVCPTIGVGVTVGVGVRVGEGVAVAVGELVGVGVNVTGVGVKAEVAVAVFVAAGVVSRLVVVVSLPVAGASVSSSASWPAGGPPNAPLAGVRATLGSGVTAGSAAPLAAVRSFSMPAVREPLAESARAEGVSVARSALSAGVVAVATNAGSKGTPARKKPKNNNIKARA